MSEIFGEILNDKNILLTNENVEIYKHIGELALYDHIFVRETRTEGFYIWNHSPEYSSTLNAAEYYKCETHSNLRTVAPSTEEAYYYEALLDSQDTIPAEWIDEQ